MIERYLRTFIIKILFFIFIKPPLFMRFGRHSTTDISNENYTKYFNIIQWFWLNFDNLETHLHNDKVIIHVYKSFMSRRIIMLNIANIYNETKYLDELFSQQYDIKSPEIIHKYKLELLVEFGELANETRCFKFWSTKQTGEREKILEEYIDCLFMILYFSNITGVSLDEDFPNTNSNDVIEVLLKLYEYGVDLSKEMSKDTVKKLLVEILYLSELLNFNLDDLEKETKKKSLIIQKRLNSDY